ncbi:MAG: hypothetical protein US53_C0067G0008 [Candidatus Woesebacteria bacterium GW2011_GWA1_37_7]|uniref:Dockerin domain-containing protein n=1 Tax=Candidatus Woesebacteria bacterium GW2011_GWA1_37_7 TaxID=1618545 RepID=A0A0G0HBQ9_9BACT|nr:MAG: hypothetical protein US53_C0067G0008 [Candidatus Woesebacteria bacterium GW2011_GWA1_37_7]
MLPESENDISKKEDGFGASNLVKLSSDFFVPFLSLFLLLLGLALILTNVGNPQLLRSKAALSTNPVSWDTQFVKLTASDFFILVGGKRFSAKDIQLSRLASDPGDRNYTTFEAGWMENGVEMRLYMNFRADNQNWWAYEIKTYDGNSPGDWKIFTKIAPYFKTPLGQTFVSDVVGLTSDDGTASIYFKDLFLEAFANSEPISANYTLTPPPGTDINMQITTSLANPEYGVSAKLYDKNGNIVSDQSDYRYEWNVEFPNIASVSLDSTCLSGMVPPCPDTHAVFRALEPGSTKIKLDVKKISLNQYIASTYWNFNVSYALFSGAPIAPSNISFFTEINPRAKGTNINLTWKDNSSDENGFLLSWTIQGSDSGSYIKDSAGSSNVPLLTIPCKTTETIYYATAMAIALNDSGTSSPAYGDASVKVPACASFEDQAFGDPRADINGDGVVNILDYVILFENFGKRVRPL